MHPVVSAVLIMAFSIAIIGMVVSFGMPLLESKKQALDFENGRTMINRISETIVDLADDPIYSSKYAEVNFPTGRMEFKDNVISLYIDSSSMNQTFENIQFNKLSIYPGKNRVKLTKASVREIHVSTE